MEPAASIILKLGGDTAVARITGVHRTRVANWKRAREVGGTGGLIPQRHFTNILSAAHAQCIPMTAADFLPTSEGAAA